MKKLFSLFFTLLIVIPLVFITPLNLSFAKDIDCDDPITTLDLNECAMEELTAAYSVLKIYLDTALKLNEDDTELVKGIQEAQESWSKYLEAHCGSVYTSYRHGSIRNIMYIECKIKLTQLRTYEVWMNFLQYMDSTPSVLPEPERKHK